MSSSLDQVILRTTRCVYGYGWYRTWSSVWSDLWIGQFLLDLTVVFQVSTRGRCRNWGAVVETGVAADSEVVNSNPLADHSFPQPTIWFFGAVYPISGQSQIRVFRSLIFYTWINLNPKFHDLDGVRLGQRCPHLASQRPEPLLGTQSQGPIGTMDMASLVEPLNPGVMRRCWVSSWDPHWPWQRQQRWI